MKKITLILLAASLVLMGSCANSQGKKKKQETKTVSTEEQYLKEDLKLKMDSLVKEMSRMSTPGMVAIQDGKITLTAKEKKVKPTYLLPASKANDAVTLNEKYRAVAMLSADMAIAELYDMPVDDYKQAISKLVVDINNPALNASKDETSTGYEAKIENFYNECVKTNTVNLFWEAIVAGTIEQLYIITQNIDGLHQKAGSQNVLEIHGSTYRNYCDRCGKQYPYDYIFQSKEAVPHCQCGGLIRPDVTLYEEALPQEAVYHSIQALRQADMLIIGGTSLTVYPAASYIREFHGKYLVVINRDPLNIRLRENDLEINDSIGQVFSQLEKRLDL